ncbi:outer membrane beta-barrel protein [Microbulbifer sp. EKSA005]|uniref:outer membrane beta-barrel protein n=1 Tax=Microbulbifer sp. EKSA005 TaxID=3243364 RepID=UPI004043149C
MNRFSPLFIIFLLSLPALTCADFYSHKYAGISFGNQHANNLCSEAEKRVQQISASLDQVDLSRCDDKNNAWKLFAGIRWTPYLAFEASYQNFNKYQLDTPISYGDGEYLNYFSDFDSQLFNIFSLAYLPLGESFSLFGKLGTGIWYAETNEIQKGEVFILYRLEDGSLIEQLTPIRGELTDSSNGFHWAYGAGINYSYRGKWSLRIEWEQFSKIGGDTFLDEIDSEAITMGWSINF